MAKDLRLADGTPTDWPGCIYCVHLHRGHLPFCDAFPDPPGIPVRYHLNEQEHLEPDGSEVDGITFHPVPNMAELLAAGKLPPKDA